MDETSGGATPDRARRGWFIAATAAVAVFAVSAGAVVLGRARDDGPARAANPGSTPGSSLPPRPDPATLVVRDGALVEAYGLVVAAPGQPVRFCPNLPTPAIGYLPGHEPAPDCPAAMAVTVVGVDLGALAEPVTVRGVRAGSAALRGTWHDGTVTVTAQSTTPPGGADPADVSLPGLPASCTAPAGGWRPGEGTDPADQSQSTDTYFEQHADQLGQPWAAWPDGEPTGPTDAPAYTDKPQVDVIPVVTGDVDRIRADLTAIYHGNMCVFRAPAGTLSIRHCKATAARFDPLMSARNSRVYETAEGLSGLVEVDFTYLDQPLYDTFRHFGLADLALHPWLRPVPA
jgi:hypothetical protein